MKWKASLQREPVSSAMPYVQVMRRAWLATTPVAASGFNCATGNFAVQMGTLQQASMQYSPICQEDGGKPCVYDILDEKINAGSNEAPTTCDATPFVRQ